jgi:hypothetical protein
LSQGRSGLVFKVVPDGGPVIFINGIIFFLVKIGLTLHQV